MELVLISNRGGSGGEPHWSRAVASRLAIDLAAAGHRVRWLCALAVGETPPPAPGVEVVALPGSAPSFRRVQARVVEIGQEVALARLLRERTADVVHGFGIGAPGSAAVCWVANRMGSVCVATARASEVLCHRGNLIDERGRDCRAWEDPNRCMQCCTTSFAGGLSPPQAWLARALRWLGGRSPFPNRLGFVNRVDAAIGGLQEAGVVFVESDAERELLVEAGLASARIRTGAWLDPSAESVLEVYRSLMS